MSLLPRLKVPEAHSTSRTIQPSMFSHLFLTPPRVSYRARFDRLCHLILQTKLDMYASGRSLRARTNDHSLLSPLFLFLLQLLLEPLIRWIPQIHLHLVDYDIPHERSNLLPLEKRDDVKLLPSFPIYMNRLRNRIVNSLSTPTE